ncbi:MAG: ThuA domain-containing protein [Luteolibacter sp.]
MKKTSSLLAIFAGLTLAAQAVPHKILFFSKSSGYEHDVISWKNGQPSFAEKVFLEIGETEGWTFEFSKDGSKFSPEYLGQFDTVIFYTTGDLTKEGRDKQPPMTADGKQALLDYIKAGNGFIGLHCATDTFHTSKDGKELSRYENHGENADPYICMIGGEFIVHGAQQEATNRVINPKFPGFENAGESFTLKEEWYTLKDFNPDIHALTVMESSKMNGPMYQRPDFPTTWARGEGKGRVYYSAMGHREDIWTHDLFKNMLIGAIKWTTGEVDAEIPSNLEEVAPEAMKLTAPPAPKEKKQRDVKPKK